MNIQNRLAFELAHYSRLIGITLILAGLLSIAGAGYVVTNPPVEEVPGEETDVQHFETSISHSATVTRETPLYDSGEQLRDMPVYFVNISPELDLTIKTNVPADRRVDVSHRLVITHTAEFNDQKFWSREEVLVDEGVTVEDGEYRSNVTIDVREVLSTLEVIQSAVGDTGTISSNIELETTYRSETQSDGMYEGTLSSSAPFMVSETEYWIDGELAATQTESRITEPTVREQPPNVAFLGQLIGAGLLALIIGSGLLYWRSRRVNLQELEQDVIRSRYDEWISSGEFPTGSGNRYIYITSLEDLVDVGIDTSKRVIYDENINAYCVVDGDLVYYHATDPTTIDSWLGLSTGSS